MINTGIPKDVHIHIHMVAALSIFLTKNIGNSLIDNLFTYEYCLWYTKFKYTGIWKLFEYNL